MKKGYRGRKGFSVILLLHCREPRRDPRNFRDSPPPPGERTKRGRRGWLGGSDPAWPPVFIADRTQGYCFSIGRTVQDVAPGGWYEGDRLVGNLSSTKITGISVLIFENSSTGKLAMGFNPAFVRATTRGCFIRSLPAGNNTKIPVDDAPLGSDPCEPYNWTPAECKAIAIFPANNWHSTHWLSQRWLIALSQVPC